jgi:hypothetical protein
MMPLRLPDHTAMIERSYALGQLQAAAQMVDREIELARANPDDPWCARSLDFALGLLDCTRSKLRELEQTDVRREAA